MNHSRQILIADCHPPKYLSNFHLIPPAPVVNHEQMPEAHPPYWSHITFPFTTRNNNLQRAVRLCERVLQVFNQALLLVTALLVETRQSVVAHFPVTFHVPPMRRSLPLSIASDVNLCYPYISSMPKARNCGVARFQCPVAFVNATNLSLSNPMSTRDLSRLTSQTAIPDERLRVVRHRRYRDEWPVAGCHRFNAPPMPAFVGTDAADVALARKCHQNGIFGDKACHGQIEYSFLNQFTNLTATGDDGCKICALIAVPYGSPGGF